jgi:hypothetical protein
VPSWCHQDPLDSASHALLWAYRNRLDEAEGSRDLSDRFVFSSDEGALRPWLANLLKRNSFACAGLPGGFPTS